MNFSISREQLINSLNDVMKAISNKVTIPILTGIKLELTERGLLLTGSDSDITIQRFIPTEHNGTVYIESEKEGSIVIPARYLNEIVKKMPKDVVTITASEQHQIEIVSGAAQFDLIGFDANDYPILPNLENEQPFSMMANVLKSIVRETVFAVSQQETRPTLTGVHFEMKEDELYAVATDSHRLARRITTLEKLPEQPFNAVIPGRSLQELSKILEDDEEIDIIIADQQVLFKTENMSFYSRLLEGTYPETSRLIPTEYETTVQLNGKSFLQAIDRASLLARERRNNIVHFETMDDQTIKITSTSPEVGEVEELIAAEMITGAPVNLAFSATYMMEALKAIDDEMIAIQFTGPMRPFILHPVDSQAVLQLILPVRT